MPNNMISYKNTLSYDQRVAKLTNRTTAELMDKIAFFISKNEKRGQDFLIINHDMLGRQIQKEHRTVRRSIKDLQMMNFIRVDPYKDPLYKKQMKIKLTSKWKDFEARNLGHDDTNLGHDDTNLGHDDTNLGHDDTNAPPQTSSSATVLEPFSTPISYNINNISTNISAFAPITVQAPSLLPCQEAVFISDKNHEEQEVIVQQIEISPETEKRAITTQEHKSNLLDEQFDQWWSLYPRKQDKKDAKTCFKRALSKVDFALLLQATKNYTDDEAIKCNIEQNGMKYIPLPTTWLNKERWLDFEHKKMNQPQEPAAPVKIAIPSFEDMICNNTGGVDLQVKQILLRVMAHQPEKYYAWVYSNNANFAVKGDRITVEGVSAFCAESIEREVLSRYRNDLKAMTGMSRGEGIAETESEVVKAQKPDVKSKPLTPEQRAEISLGFQQLRQELDPENDIKRVTPSFISRELPMANLMSRVVKNVPSTVFVLTPNEPHTCRTSW